MTASELIAHLEEFKEQHGDIVIKMFDNIYQEFYAVREVTFRQAVVTPEDTSEPFGDIA